MRFPVKILAFEWRGRRCGQVKAIVMGQCVTALARMRPDATPAKVIAHNVMIGSRNLGSVKRSIEKAIAFELERHLRAHTGSKRDA